MFDVNKISVSNEIISDFESSGFNEKLKDARAII